MVLDKSLDREKVIEARTDGKGKKDFHRQLCERLNLGSARDRLPHISSQKLEPEKTDHPIGAKTDEKEKKGFHRRLCEGLNLDPARDHWPHISSQKFGAEKTDHPIESRKEAPSLPDDQRHQAMLFRNNEMIHSYRNSLSQAS